MDPKLLVQKLASISMLMKNFDKFEAVRTVAERHPDAFRHYMELANKHSNEHSLFGENIEPRFTEDGQIAMLVPVDKAGSIGSHEVLGQFKSNDKVEYMLVSQDTAYRYLGEQSTNLIAANIKNIEKGVFISDGIQLNSQSMMNMSGHIDKNIATQIGRNVYLNKKVDTVNDLGFVQWQMLRESGIMMSKSEVDRMIKANPSTKDNYIQLSKDNPLVEGAGTTYWYDKRYIHYMEGTKGLNIRGVAKSISGNKAVAEVVESAIVTVAKAVNVLKRVVLIARPNSYINSAVSSMTTYTVHGSNVVMNMKADFKAAGQLTDVYKTKLKSYTAEYMKNPNSKATKEALTKLEADEYHQLMKAGIVTTLRSDLYAVSDVKDVTSFAALKRAGGEEYANALRWFTLDESTATGKALATAFDFTELRPKLMLYTNLVRSGKSPKIAMQTVLMAYPTYNNLGYLTNVIDQFSPYTKFFTSVPRIVMYGIDQKPKRWAVGAAISAGVVPASYAFSSEQDMAKLQKWEDRGYLKVPGMDYGLPTSSWGDIFGVTPGGLTGRIADTTFPVSAADSMTKTSTYVPGTSFN